MKFYQLSVLLLFPFLSCNHASESPKASQLSDTLQNHKRDKTEMANIIFRSTDDGQSWQDITKGLPENLQKDSIRGNTFFANDKGLFLKVGKAFYHSTPNATAPFWKAAISVDQDSTLSPGKSGIFDNHYWGVNLKTTNGMSVWSPMFDNSHEPRIRSVFETSDGTIFLGTDRGLFKTMNNGKTWKHVFVGAYAGHLAELNGVLVAIGMKRIIRSTDNGENWAVMTGESNIAWDVKQIKGGFAAITSSSESGTRTLTTSYDGGKTWQSIGASPQDKVVNDSIWRTWNNRLRLQAFPTSIIQVGENFFCTHRDGIFKSSDKGKTWKLLLPAIKDKFFSLFVSGNVIYAISSKGGC